MQSLFSKMRWASTSSRSCVLAILVLTTASHADPPIPLTAAHAHNDYVHERPLTDALGHGFCSVEADVFLVGGRLLVGHDRSELRPDRTLERLYLDPLQERINQNRGRVYRGGPLFLLLIDFKSAGQPTYDVLVERLRPYAEMLDRIVDGQRQPGAIRIVISGNRPFDAVAKAYKGGNCFVAIDGRLSDLDQPDLPPWMPLISDRWTRHFRWKGRDPISSEESKRLEQIVRKTHRHGCRLRFWATPDRPQVWETLRAAGVDLINTDDLAGLSQFLLSERGALAEPDLSDQSSTGLVKIPNVGQYGQN